MWEEERVRAIGVRALRVAARQTRHARGSTATQGCGGQPGTRGANVEHTYNMAYMVVALDVSKLSVWLSLIAAVPSRKAGVRCAGRGVRPGR